MAALTVPLPAEIVALAAGQPAAVQAAVDEAVRILRSPTLSLWPVNTGRSRRAWRRLGSGATSRIFNPLSYASFIERRKSPAKRTLARHAAKLRAAAMRAARGETSLSVSPRKLGTVNQMLDLVRPGGRRARPGELALGDRRAFVPGAVIDDDRAAVSRRVITAAANRRAREERRRHAFERHVENLERQGGRRWSSETGGRAVAGLKIPAALKRLDRQIRKRAG